MNRIFIPVAMLLFTFALHAQDTTRTDEYIEITATKIAEDVTIVPAAITVIDGEDIEQRNASDLASALGFVSGVSIAPGGDSGPAGSVPEMWGLREFDAFLLVVDGVPWGGAFNPDLPTLDMNGIDRIEVLRGAAPVMYGATSFVGVIHVIHKAPGTGDTTARLSAGSFGSGSANVVVPLPSSTALAQTLIAGIERRGFHPDRSGYDRAHALYRLSSGALRFDLDATVLKQDPYSPHLREGRQLSTTLPLDANHNPSNARIDENRFHGVLGVDSTLGTSPWTTTLALTHSSYDILRGFIHDDYEQAPNASGFMQDRSITDLYFDSHLVRTLAPALRIIAGVDYLHGRGTADSGLFDYSIPISGDDAPEIDEADFDEETSIRDTRDFAGLYASAEWTPVARLRFDAGLRFNHTKESRTTETEDESGDESRTKTRPSGSVGVNWKAWESGRDAMSLFADYRDTFKPAAIDFGPEAEGEMLDPETARSYEVGAKGRFLGGRFAWQFSAFQMDFENLVVSIVENGLPAVGNAGSERFRGAELEFDYEIASALRWESGYSYHDARFADYERSFDGAPPTQLAGKRLEMSPFHLLGTGLVYSPATGLNAHVLMNYVGSRYLNMRNTALADAYTTWAAGVGYRLGKYEIRVDGRNLSDERPPVAESELGDAQYYRMPARSIDVSYRFGF